MKIFLDTASILDIQNRLHIIDGITTNPSLMIRESNNVENHVKKIVEITEVPISVEVFSDDYDGMVKEAINLSCIAPNIVIKIPATDEGLKAVSYLEKKGIKTNVTLVFSATQALIAAKMGASYISLFIGRLDDIGHDSMLIIKDCLTILNNFRYKSELIAASIRHPQHVLNVGIVGCHCATIPPSVLDKLIIHPLTINGLDQFMKDWKEGQ